MPFFIIMPVYKEATEISIGFFCSACFSHGFHTASTGVGGAPPVGGSLHLYLFPACCRTLQASFLSSGVPHILMLVGERVNFLEPGFTSSSVYIDSARRSRREPNIFSAPVLVHMFMDARECLLCTSRP